MASTNVEFKTSDGLTLRGRLYAASSRGPAIIMTPGLNIPAHGLYDEIAGCFQSAGITAFLYDNRSVGASDGSPRCEPNPPKHTEDLHEAISFLKSFPSVDPRRIALWGYSLSGTCVLAAAALDNRVKLVITVCPALPLDVEDPAVRKRFLPLAMQDVESRARGHPPLIVPYIGSPSEGDGSVFDYSMFKGTENITADQAVKVFEDNIPHFRNDMSVRGLYNMIAWPFDHHMVRHVGENTPVLMMVAGDEEVPHFKKKYESIYETLRGPKQFHVIPGGGHLDCLLVNEHFPGTVKVMVDFVQEHFDME